MHRLIFVCTQKLWRFFQLWEFELGGNAQRAMTFLWIGLVGGRVLWRNFSSIHSHIEGIRSYPPPHVWPTGTGARVWICTPLVSPIHISERNYRAARSLLSLSLFTHNTPSLRTSPLLTAQDAKGNIYRLAGKAKRLAFRAFHQYRLRFHACWDSGRQGIHLDTFF